MRPWVGGSVGRFALGLKNFLTPPNSRNRAYSIRRPFDKNGRNTCWGNVPGQSNCGVFSCFKRGGKSGCERLREFTSAKDGRYEDPKRNPVEDNLRLQGGL